MTFDELAGRRACHGPLLGTMDRARLHLRLSVALSRQCAACCSPTSSPPPPPSRRRARGSASRRPRRVPAPRRARRDRDRRQLPLGRAAPARTGVGWAALRDLPAAAPAPEPRGRRGRRAPSRAIEAAGGPGSAAARREELGALFARATADEQRFLAHARRRRAAPGRARRHRHRRGGGRRRRRRRPPCAARRCWPATCRAVAEAALHAGRGGLGGVPAAGRAARAADARQDRAVARGRARSRSAPAAVEWKLDGVRIQVHRDGDDVALFTRTLDPVTERMPEIVEAVRALPLRSVILDGEAIALRARRAAAAVPGDREPRREPRRRRRRCARPCRSRRSSSTSCTSTAATSSTCPRSERLRRDRARPAGGRVGAALVTADAARRRRRSLDDALARGHEGVVVKSLDAPYEAGPPRRRLAQGQARAHARPRRARRRVGPRPAAGLALEPPPGRARPRERRLR